MRFLDLQQQMQHGATLLVPTQRAARAWTLRLFNTGAAELPRVLPWAAWAEQQWQNLLLAGYDGRALLTPLQNIDLWAQVLQSAQPGTLRPIRSLVRLCTAAQHLVHTHGATDRLLHFHGEPGSDIAVFADWFRSYTARCDTERLLPASALDEALARHIADGGMAPAHMPTALLGFDHLSPAQQHLVNVLNATGSPIDMLDAADLSGIVPSGATLLRCEDEHHETTSLVQALRAHLQADAPVASSPDAPILVVLPDAEASRPALDRALRDAFRDAPTNTAQWEFAAGVPLATIPVIADALDLLRWANGPLSSDIAGRLLQSPFLHLRLDRDRAGELDAEVLRDGRRLRPDWSLAALAHRVESREPGLSEILLRLSATAAQQLRGEHLPGDWAHRVQAVLQTAGWPGNRERTSVDFQRIDRWNELLESLATLDLFDRRMTFEHFFDNLEAAATETLFAPENTGAPIQIVSPAEAAGITAGELWFAHATEDQWSARRSPSPLLPWHLQVECGMPGTDPARDGELHRRTTARLLASAPAVTLSYAAMNGHGELRPATVFDTLHLAEAPPLPPTPTKATLEQFVDDTRLPPLPEGIVHGGVGVLKDQAACAFRAFAERRLFSSEPDRTTLGLDPRQRGELLHVVLQHFWDETKTQAELLHLQATGALAGVLQRHIDSALQAPGTTDVWNAAYLDLQRRRLHSLLMKWFDLEAQRPPFRVLQTEHQVPNVAVGPLHFNLRVDRIDEVVRDGEPTLALIDYKTGSPSTSSWAGPRPDEPQLPLYAVAASLENVGAIAFATVRPGDKHLGLRAEPRTTELLFPGKHDKNPEQFDAQMEEWYTTVNRLAEEFASGDARVGPKQYPNTCNFCGQRMLCRLNPELLEDLGAEDAPETAS